MNLIYEIEKLRKVMEEEIDKGKSLNCKEVMILSRELDVLIVNYLRENNK